MPLADEPCPFDPKWPRHSPLPFPARRYVPGRGLHPRRRGTNDAHLAVEAAPVEWSPAEWPELEPWLYAVDLYNYAYWWECHEQLEVLWLGAGRTRPHALFVQGLIKVAAACLNRWLGKTATAASQADEGAAQMLATALRDGDPYMGIATADFAARVRGWFSHSDRRPPLLRLVVP